MTMSDNTIGGTSHLALYYNNDLFPYLTDELTFYTTKVAPPTINADAELVRCLVQVPESICALHRNLHNLRVTFSGPFYTCYRAEFDVFVRVTYLKIELTIPRLVTPVMDISGYIAFIDYTRAIIVIRGDYPHLHTVTAIHYPFQSPPLFSYAVGSILGVKGALLGKTVAVEVVGIEIPLVRPQLMLSEPEYHMYAPL